MDLASTNRAIKTVVIKMECSYFIRKFRGTNKYIELIYPLTFITSDISLNWWVFFIVLEPTALWFKKALLIYNIDLDFEWSDDECNIKSFQLWSVPRYLCCTLRRFLIKKKNPVPVKEVELKSMKGKIPR